MRTDGVIRRTVAAALTIAACATLASCGQEKVAAAPPAPPPSKPCAAAEPPTDEDTGELPDETTDQTSPGTGADETTDDASPGTGADETTDETSPGTGADETTDETSPGTGADETTDDASTGTGTDETTDADCVPVGWYDLRRDFIAYLAGPADPFDDDLPARVERVRMRTSGAGGQAQINVSVGTEGGDVDRIAKAFAAWRREVYGDHGTVDVSFGAKDGPTSAAW